MIQEAFYFHFDHFKISKNELAKKRLQPQCQPSRLQILADFEKYNDLQAISNLASVVQSKSLAETSRKIQNDFNQSNETANQYRNLESNFHSNNDLIWSLSGRWVYTRNSKGRIFRKYDCILKTNFRGLARQQVEKFSVLNSEGFNKLETAKQAQIDAHKLEVQSDSHFEMLKHEDNAKKMVEMGFTDKSFNLSALIQSNGSINDAIGKSTARFPRHATCTYNHIIYVKLQSLSSNPFPMFHDNVER